MTTNHAIRTEENATRGLTRRTLAIGVLGTLALLSAACGIDFGEASRETDVFKDLKVIRYQAFDNGKEAFSSIIVQKPFSPL